jgi:hypothetical protein
MRLSLTRDRGWLFKGQIKDGHERQQKRCQSQAADQPARFSSRGFGTKEVQVFSRGESWIRRGRLLESLVLGALLFDELSRNPIVKHMGFRTAPREFPKARYRRRTQGKAGQIFKGLAGLCCEQNLAASHLSGRLFRGVNQNRNGGRLPILGFAEPLNRPLQTPRGQDRRFEGRESCDQNFPLAGNRDAL